MQNIELLCGGLHRASQQWSAPPCCGHLAHVIPFSVGDNNYKKVALSASSCFYCLCEYSTSKSKSASLYPYQSNQSGRTWALLLYCMCEIDRPQTGKKEASFLFILWCLWGKISLLDSLSENIQIHLNPLWRNPDMVQTHWDLTQSGPCWHTCTLKLLAICYRGTGHPCNADSCVHN